MAETRLGLSQWTNTQRYSHVSQAVGGSDSGTCVHEVLSPRQCRAEMPSTHVTPFVG